MELQMQDSNLWEVRHEGWLAWLQAGLLSSPETSLNTEHRAAGFSMGSSGSWTGFVLNNPFYLLISSFWNGNVYLFLSCICILETYNWDFCTPTAEVCLSLVEALGIGINVELGKDFAIIENGRTFCCFKDKNFEEPEVEYYNLIRMWAPDYADV